MSSPIHVLQNEKTKKKFNLTMDLTKRSDDGSLYTIFSYHNVHYISGIIKYKDAGALNE